MSKLQNQPPTTLFYEYFALKFRISDITCMLQTSLIESVLNIHRLFHFTMRILEMWKHLQSYIPHVVISKTVNRRKNKRKILIINYGDY